MLLWAPVSPRKFNGASYNTFVHDVFEEADVGTERAVIKRRIHLLWNAAQHGNLIPHR